MSAELLSAGASPSIVIEPAPSPYRYILGYQQALWNEIFSTDFNTQSAAYFVDAAYQSGDLVVTGGNMGGEAWAFHVGMGVEYQESEFSPDEMQQLGTDYFSAGGTMAFVVGRLESTEGSRRIVGLLYSVEIAGGALGNFLLPLYDASDELVQAITLAGQWNLGIGAATAPVSEDQSGDPIDEFCWDWASMMLQRCYDDAYSDYATCGRIAVISIIGGLIAIPFSAGGSLTLIGVGAATAFVCETAWRSSNATCLERFDEDYALCIAAYDLY